MTESNTNTAPFPHELAGLVRDLVYRPGWEFHLEVVDRGQGSTGLTLDIVTRGYNSRHLDQGENYRVHHYMPVPPASYNYTAWRRWLLDQLLLVERHEACEFFTVAGERPFAPRHGPGHDPYTIVEYGTDEERRTRFTGEVRPA